MDELAGKVALVTGAASGIGLALAEAFQREGMSVVLADVESGPLHAAAVRLAEGGDVLAVRTDVSQEDDVVALRDAAIRRFGQVNVVCNNAGVGGGGPVAEAPLNVWRWVLGVNLWGVIHGCTTFLPHLLEHGDGHIVNTGSIAGLVSFPGMGAYNVSKHGVVTLTETLYNELEAQGSTVGATVLCPGFVATRIIESERNRPESLSSPLVAEDPQTAQMRAVVSELYRQQLAPGAVAPKVIAAIRANNLYCYTDAEFDDVIAARHSAVQSGTNPAVLPMLFERLVR